MDYIEDKEVNEIKSDIHNANEVIGKAEYDDFLFPKIFPFNKTISWKDLSLMPSTYREIGEKKKLALGKLNNMYVYTPNVNFNQIYGYIYPVKLNQKTINVLIPAAGGIAFGLLDGNCSLYNATIKKTDKLFYEILLKCGEAMIHPRLMKEPLLPSRQLPPIEDCSELSWWPKEVQELSKNSMSTTMAALMFMSQRKRKPGVWFFTTDTEKNESIIKWNAEMLILKLKTYVFCPFIFEYLDIDGRRKHMVAQYNIPAFNKIQARLIMGKRLFEFRRPLDKGKMFCQTEELVNMGYPEKYLDGNILVTKAPKLNMIPILGTENTSIVDFNLILEESALFSNKIPTLDDIGHWTSCDLGFLFSLIYTKELGIKTSQNVEETNHSE